MMSPFKLYYAKLKIDMELKRYHKMFIVMYHVNKLSMRKFFFLVLILLMAMNSGKARYFTKILEKALFGKSIGTRTG